MLLKQSLHSLSTSFLGGLVVVICPCLLGILPSTASGQATTIQQPQFTFNTVTTTVTAPDGGTVLLGGIKRGSEGSVERGVPILGKVPGLNRLFKNRGIGRQFQTSSHTVVPRIIILEEEEERQVGRPTGSYSSNSPTHPLGGPRTGVASAGYAPDPISRQAASLSSHISRSSQFAPLAPVGQEVRQPSVAIQSTVVSADQIRRENELAAVQRDSEAAKFYAKGQAAVAEGRTGSAKVFFNMALRRADGSLRQMIQAELDQLSQ